MVDGRDMADIIRELRTSLNDVTDKISKGAEKIPALQDSTANMMIAMKTLLDSYAEGVGKMSTLIVETNHDESSLRKACEDVAESLQTSIDGFRKKLNPRLLNKRAGQLPPNVGQIIGAVIEYTEQSTIKNLGFLGQQEELKNRRSDLVGKLDGILKSGNPDEFKADLHKFVGQMHVIESDANDLHVRMLENQSFQDLTGQALQLLIWLVNSVESNLKKLADDTGIKIPEGSENSQSDVKHVGNQADIDALLDSLD
jgi:chemotaxis regulatin CheY-phosphate phosphatase CheZ